jgi:CheY-like chemotaxis protein
MLVGAQHPRCDGRHISLWITAQFPFQTPLRPCLIFCAWLPIFQIATAAYVKILLVDDSKPILHANERALHKAGYEVVCAEDGESALKLARECNPDLILLDMILPKISGPEVLAQLKNDPATVDIPVVVLSSLTEKNRQKLIEAGAEEYLEKNSLSPLPGVNLLPQILENVICRINRKRGVAFSSVPHEE